MKQTYKYQFRCEWYDVEAMMNSGLVIGFSYVTINGFEFMNIETSDCCDHWFA